MGCHHSTEKESALEAIWNAENAIEKLPQDERDHWIPLLSEMRSSVETGNDEWIKTMKKSATWLVSHADYRASHPSPLPPSEKRYPITAIESKRIMQEMVRKELERQKGRCKEALARAVEALDRFKEEIPESDHFADVVLSRLSVERYDGKINEIKSVIDATIVLIAIQSEVERIQRMHEVSVAFLKEGLVITRVT